MLSLKMLFAFFVTLFASMASARIIGVAVPDTVKAGQGFNAIIMVENYIQSVYDVAIAFGIKPGTQMRDIVGEVMGSYYLGPGKSFACLPVRANTSY